CRRREGSGGAGLDAFDPGGVLIAEPRLAARAASAEPAESQDLRGRETRHTMPAMQQEQVSPALPLHPQDEMECRRCEVHCDKVVYPGACLARSCPFVYSSEGFGHHYVGCMQKIYDVEIDLEMLRAAEQRKAGFGAIRAMRQTLPMCHTQVEQPYAD